MTSTRRCGDGYSSLVGEAGQAPRHLPGRHGLDELAPAQFTIGERLYGMQFDDYPEEELDETEYTSTVALAGERAALRL